MQLAIELPDELGKQILQHKNVQEFAIKAFRKLLLEEQQNNFIQEKTDTPITNSLVGILKGSNLDESDYKKHLEEKYL